jgi:hypothetical protein
MPASPPLRWMPLVGIEAATPLFFYKAIEVNNKQRKGKNT